MTSGAASPEPASGVVLRGASRFAELFSTDHARRPPATMAFQALNAPPAVPPAAAAPPPAVPTATYPHRSGMLATIDRAFADRPELRSAIQQTLAHDGRPEQLQLFENIAQYVLELRAAPAPAPVPARDAGNDDRDSKRRKLDGGSPAPRHAPGLADYAGPTFPGLSFTVPQRKKLTLEVGAAPTQGLRALSAASEIEFGVAYRDLEHVFRLPVPDKAQPQHTFVAFPRAAVGLAGDAAPPVAEPLVWTAPDTLAKGAPANTPTPSQAVHAALQAAGVAVQEPSAAEFVCAPAAPSARPGPPAFHVRGFRGSKEGFLFLLAPGLVWAFRKPLLFLPLRAIASVSYTAVLQRTFNLVVVVGSDPDAPAGGDAAAEQELEFAMLDQADFAGIDAYVKRHGLNDASMAEARRAKRLNVNGPARGRGDGSTAAEGDAAGGAAGAEEPERELDKAQREIEMQAGDDDDDDEEDDENFDPGSEGDSEGSGSSDEDEENGAAGDGAADDDADDDDDDDEV